MQKGFTLLELIVVIVILGILATLGYSQYNKQVESTRVAEAKVRLGLMRQLVIEYYWKNGSLDGIQDSDIGGSWTCTSDGFYACRMRNVTSAWIDLIADSCTSGGKVPNASRRYLYYLRVTPSTGNSSWGCNYADDNSPCGF
jgi:prepilin-type N-terminal cleavage/methylation domain-containing protein